MSNQIESAEQKTIIKWFRVQWPEHALCTRLSHNGSHGHGLKAIQKIKRLKAEGMVSGESDLLFTVARGVFHGLAMEYKAGNGTHKLTENQAEYLNYMEEQGYLAVCCKGIEQAKEVIQNYMNNCYNG